MNAKEIGVVNWLYGIGEIDGRPGYVRPQWSQRSRSALQALLQVFQSGIRREAGRIARAGVEQVSISDDDDLLGQPRTSKTSEQATPGWRNDDKYLDLIEIGTVRRTRR